MNNWKVNREILLSDGRSVCEREIVRIDGEQGRRYMFIRHVINLDNDAEWVDCYEMYKGSPGAVCSFRPNRLRPLKAKRKTAKPVARPKATGDADIIRQWAQENNVPVAPRGRISKDVRERYYLAQK